MSVCQRCRLFSIIIKTGSGKQSKNENKSERKECARKDEGETIGRKRKCTGKRRREGALNNTTQANHKNQKRRNVWVSEKVRDFTKTPQNELWSRLAYASALFLFCCAVCRSFCLSVYLLGCPSLHLSNHAWNKTKTKEKATRSATSQGENEQQHWERASKRVEMQASSSRSFCHSRTQASNQTKHIYHGQSLQPLNRVRLSVPLPLFFHPSHHQPTTSSTTVANNAKEKKKKRKHPTHMKK